MITPTDTVVSEERLREILYGCENAHVYVLDPATVASMARELLSRRTAKPQSGGVVVKGLEWHGPDYEGEYWAASIAERYVIRAPNGNGYWLGGVGGYFPSVDEAKAAAEKHHQARIRSTLADPIPEAPADEEVEGAARQPLSTLGRGSEWVNIWRIRDGEWVSFVGRVAADGAIEYEHGGRSHHNTATHWSPIALRRSTETDKPGVREAYRAHLSDLDALRAYAGKAGHMPLVDLISKDMRVVDQKLRALSASPLTREDSPNV